MDVQKKLEPGMKCKFTGVAVAKEDPKFPKQKGDDKLVRPSTLKNGDIVTLVRYDPGDIIWVTKKSGSKKEHWIREANLDPQI